MIDENEKQNLRILTDLLKKNGMIRHDNLASLMITTLAGDGSSRKFWRVSLGGESLCLAVAPPTLDNMDLREAQAARDIGLHLLQQGVCLPKQVGWDAESGLLLFEDLGDCKLHDMVLGAQNSDKKMHLSILRPLYQQAVQQLANMQVKGAESFDTDWCWDTKRYDKDVMLERESGYFLRAFWQDLLTQQTPAGLQEEFVLLADKAAAVKADYFLHRDFQSRNIMVCRNEVRFIDYQGGRQGPLAYDLASLLIDPYTQLPEEFQEELYATYLDTLGTLIDVEPDTFREEYLLLALQRNLQIVGAFSFLSSKRKKVFFKQFIQPALSSLNSILVNPLFDELRILRQTVRTAFSLNN